MDRSADILGTKLKEPFRFLDAIYHNILFIMHWHIDLQAEDEKMIEIKHDLFFKNMVFS